MALAALIAHESPALAHDGVDAHRFGSLWHWDPLVLLGLFLGAWVYGRGITRLWRRAGTGRGVRRWQVASYAIGLAVLAVALISPLAGLAEILFSAHMAQHLLLILVVPPLLLVAAPQLAAPLALPRHWRRPLAAMVRRVEWQDHWGPLALIWLVQMTTLWVWHLPRFYEAALRSELIHVLEHVTLMGTALLFWSVVLRPITARRDGFGAAIVFVIATALPNGLLGALITLAPSAWYATYTASATAWGMTPLVDQQVAGLLMWIPPGLVYVGVVAGLLLGWLGRAETQQSIPSHPSPSPTVKGARETPLSQIGRPETPWAADGEIASRREQGQRLDAPAAAHVSGN